MRFLVASSYALSINHVVTASGLYGRTQGYPFSVGFVAITALVAAIGSWAMATGVHRVRHKRKTTSEGLVVSPAPNRTLPGEA